MEIADEMGSEESLKEDFESFLRSVPEGSSLLKVMQLYLISLLSPGFKTQSDDMCSIVTQVLKRLEIHNYGINSFRMMERFQENKEQLCLTLLSLSEIIFEGISESDLETVRFRYINYRSNGS